ncbi:hypothetical protein LP419_08915 [Massilia sp. H-1]|nr:hypothetical protein LP419_08915 [Massilia sp. H-1]
MKALSWSLTPASLRALCRQRRRRSRLSPERRRQFAARGGRHARPEARGLQHAAHQGRDPGRLAAA